MTETNTRTKKRAAKEVDSATHSTSASKKARKRTPEQQAAAAEAMKRTEENCAAKRTAKEKNTVDQQAALQDLAGTKNKRGLSLDREELIQRALEKAYREEYRAPSDDHTPTKAREFENKLRFDSAPSTRSSPKQLSAATEQRVDPKEAQENAMDSTNKARERKSPTQIVHLSAPAISAVYAKNTVAEITKASKEISAKTERESTGLEKYLVDRASK